METKGVGQQGIEKCLGRSQGPNCDVKPSVLAVVAEAVAVTVAAVSVAETVEVAVAAAAVEVVAVATDLSIIQRTLQNNLYLMFLSFQFCLTDAGPCWGGNEIRNRRCSHS
jgi:hypothetical protein